MYAATVEEQRHNMQILLRKQKCKNALPQYSSISSISRDRDRNTSYESVLRRCTSYMFVVTLVLAETGSWLCELRGPTTP